MNTGFIKLAAVCLIAFTAAMCGKKQDAEVNAGKSEMPQYVPPRIIKTDEEHKAEGGGYPFEPYNFAVVKPAYPPAIEPPRAKEIIEERVKKVTETIQNKNMMLFSQYLYPGRKILFGIFTEILPTDLSFSKEEILGFFADESEYTWGKLSPSGLDLRATKTEFFNKYIYHDFNQDVKIGCNEIITYNGYPQWQFRDFPDSIVVEYGFPNVQGPFDWEGFRIVFQEYQGEWYVAAFLRSSHYQ
ncbi:MAG: hypothetical protein E4H36_12740 [Spirochaetales bacterium]|nr:MAG: hypothetical protein E4H36_12740 [Spirochaetales bacterium]